MLKKFIKKLVLIIILIILVGVCAFKAYASDEVKTNFATVTSNDVYSGEVVNITLNLQNIKYEQYTVILESDVDISKPTASSDNNKNTISSIVDSTDENNLINNNENVNNVVDFENSNVKKFTISDIENFNDLILAITIPENLQVGSKIDIIISIVDKNDSNNKLDTQIVLNVIEKTENNNTENTNQAQDKENQQSQQNSTFTSKSTVQDISSVQSSTTKSSAQTGSVGSSLSQNNSQSITYDGSDDNYLTNLSINGENISNFNKTNTTYFKTISDDIDSIEISYDKSNSNSTVCIYGNNDLKSGLNKILISVTAENGSVKNYRIFVTIK